MSRDLTTRLGTLPDAIRREVSQAMFAAGERIQIAAQISITTGSSSAGRHIPSLPNTPPNNDTGVLANNIETVQVAPLRVEVSSNAPYAKHLETGTSRMAARPYMAPAANSERPAVERILRDAARRALRKHLRNPR